MGFMTRTPDSNDPPFQEKNPWGSQNDLLDDTAVLLNNLGRRCCICKRVVLKAHLTCETGRYYCPDDAPPSADSTPQDKLFN